MLHRIALPVLTDPAAGASPERQAKGPLKALGLLRGTDELAGRRCGRSEWADHPPGSDGNEPQS